ncbi:MAG: tungstate transport system ATP-binding protein [Bacillota bacterium]|nr:tungstate transport system ATP-binding protein [Bacillota bacterium]MDK2924471.1 tungstate transport system ATP-binding protein [Bacillota bacterium]
MTAVLEARDIVIKKGGRRILSVDHLAVEPGEVLAIIGPNGAGKSTLLTVLACLDLPTSGAVFFHGRRVTRANALAVRRRLAVVFQEPLLLDTTVLENAAIGLKLRGRRREAEAKARAWLARFGVGHLAAQQALTLSGGEAQRVSLARAFALEPEVLLLDEPFASVDVIARAGLIQEFKSILSSTGTTAVLVTHDFREVSALATRVAVLFDGTVQAEGPPEAIAAHPRWGALADPRTASGAGSGGCGWH